MMRALHAVVHKKATPEDARDLFEEIKEHFKKIDEEYN